MSTKLAELVIDPVREIEEFQFEARWNNLLPNLPCDEQAGGP